MHLHKLHLLAEERLDSCWGVRGGSSVGLLNVDGYYNYLLNFIDKAVDDGFIKPSQRHIFVSAPNAKEPIQKLEEYVAVQDEVVVNLKWEIQLEQLSAPPPLPPPKQVGFKALH
ncbi:cytokinin riboside 5'-monophosphate phosphoribohydrolase LOG5-like [Forsythia ovata]|uniref:cytokinin riboside 5'-monophosphate phosphoribohydrolase n=1 Tax=Forsythia ovata TaxID=205694 RepID=A0ABD1RM10_9LAMI